MDGRVEIEGCEVNFIPLPVEEVFHRAYIHQEFDVAEIGFSPFLISLSRGISPYVAIPAFLSRMFRHNAVYIRRDRKIRGPEDLRGKRIGVPEFQMSAVMWVRGMLNDEHGIKIDEINWVQGGLEEFGRTDKFPLNLPEGFPLETVPEGKTLNSLLQDGGLDAVISARAPSCFISGCEHVGRLYEDFRSEEKEYYKRSKVFPIMHAVGIRNEIVDQHPWLPASVYKAFLEAKKISDSDLTQVAALKVTLPWLTAELEETKQVMGEDYWPYGIDANRHTLETMARYSYEQGLATRLLGVEEMFAESAMSVTKV